jgi:hypothetical protein
VEEGEGGGKHGHRAVWERKERRKEEVPPGTVNRANGLCHGADCAVTYSDIITEEWDTWRDRGCAQAQVSCKEENQAAVATLQTRVKMEIAPLREAKERDMAVAELELELILSR